MTILRHHGCVLGAVLLSMLAMTLDAHAGRIERHSVPSASLGRSIAYALYIPQQAAPGLPVLYLLHGKGDDEMAWPDKGNIAAIADRKIASGEIKPMLIVMPMVSNSWYVDDARPIGYGPVARAFLSDFVQHVESLHRGGPACRGARGVGGLSMGGYGAMLYAFERPDLFAAAFSLSGSLFSEQAADIAARRQSYERIYEGVFGVPFDERRFLAWNVFTRLDRPRAKTPAVWLAAGDRDFPSILAGTVRFHEELRRRGHDSHLHILPGEHSWAFWEQTVDQALSWLSAQLDPACR